MANACTAARIDLLTNDMKAEILKALAAELGFILYPASRTVVIFHREYILARVPAPERPSNLLWFPRTRNEEQSNLNHH